MAVGLCYQADVKLAGFQFQFEASRVSGHTDELWYEETVCLWMTIYIYIYIIYIYIHIYMEVNKGKESDNEVRNIEIQGEEFNIKESRRL